MPFARRVRPGAGAIRKPPAATRGCRGTRRRRRGPAIGAGQRVDAVAVLEMRRSARCSRRSGRRGCRPSNASACSVTSPRSLPMRTGAPSAIPSCCRIVGMDHDARPALRFARLVGVSLKDELRKVRAGDGREPEGMASRRPSRSTSQWSGKPGMSTREPHGRCCARPARRPVRLEAELPVRIARSRRGSAPSSKSGWQSIQRFSARARRACPSPNCAASSR